MRTMIEEDVRQLAAYSAKWGSDLHVVQGPGGNTSWKGDGRLVIKASGMRLSEATSRQIFVEVGLSDALAMANGAAAPATSSGLRPSIETSFHAVLPHKFVMHTHPVDVIAFAARSDGEEALAPLLKGLRWGWVPYVKPGAAIALEVADMIQREPLDVIVLGNHGLIIGGSSCAEIDEKFTSIRTRLRSEVRSGQRDEKRLVELADRFGLEPARYPDAHLAAADPLSLSYATAGTLYPDHVVFLGRGAAGFVDGKPPADAASLLYLAPGAGALLPVGAPPEAHELAACLGAVSARIISGASLNTLTKEQEDELLDWDAETYRKSLAAAAQVTH